MQSSDPSVSQTVLVIDDSEIVLMMAQQRLEGAGYRVVTSNNAIGNIFIINRERPDLILMDVNMPAVDGPTLVAQLRDNDRIRCLPQIVLYSDLAHDELRRAATACRADGYIRKDGDGEAFIKQVCRYLGRRRS